MNRKLLENQAQLVQSEKMAGIGQIAAGVAHEINNPVGFIKSNLGTLTEYVGVFKNHLASYETLHGAILKRKPLDNDIKKYADDIEQIREKDDIGFILDDVDKLLAESVEGANRVQDIVEGLNRFARIDKGEIQEADINERIETTLRVVWNELKYKCEVRKNFGVLPLILCCPGQLDQVFMNLIVNASQAISSRGVITIDTAATDTHVVVRISDTGEGIPPENIRKLFDPFFTTKTRGTGLGLSVSFGIVKSHNGIINVESEAGKGTTFTVRLPIEGADHE